KLVRECRQVSFRDRFIKWSIPSIEADLRRCGRADHNDRADGQDCKAVSPWRKPKGDDEFAEFMNQVADPFGNRLRIQRDLHPRFSLVGATSGVLFRPCHVAAGLSFAVAVNRRLATPSFRFLPALTPVENGYRA